MELIFFKSFSFGQFHFRNDFTKLRDGAHGVCVSISIHSASRIPDARTQIKEYEKPINLYLVGW